MKKYYALFAYYSHRSLLRQERFLDAVVDNKTVVLNNMGSFEKRPDGFAGEFFDLLFNSADIANFAPEDKIKYLNDMTTERDIHNQIEYARKEGIEKGREEGRKEERRLIAQKCKAEGMSIEMIIRLSGLTEQEILSL